MPGQVNEPLPRHPTLSGHRRAGYRRRTLPALAPLLTERYLYQQTTNECNDDCNCAKEMAEHLVFQFPAHEQAQREMWFSLQVLTNP